MKPNIFKIGTAGLVMVNLVACGGDTAGSNNGQLTPSIDSNEMLVQPESNPTPTEVSLMKTKKIKNGVACVVAASLAGCGGGATDSDGSQLLPSLDSGETVVQAEPTPTPTPTPQPTEQPVVEVEEPNSAPTAVDDFVEITEDSALSGFNVLTNDFDEDGDVITVVGSSTTQGQVSIDGGGSVIYTPEENYFGDVIVTYTISDGENTDQGQLTIRMTPTQDIPVVNGEEITINEDESVINLAVLDNDIDNDSQTLTVVSAEAGNGIVSINSNGTLSYSPAVNYFGADTIEYSVTDGVDQVPGTVTITIVSVNDEPVANNDSDVSVDEDSEISAINVLANDTDVETAVSALTVASATADNGVVVINETDQTLTYTPNANFNGSDTVVYTISDGEASSSPAQFNVTVNSINDAPVAVDDNANGRRGQAISNIAVLDNDEDVDNDTLSISLLAEDTPTASNGTVSIDGDTLTYVPNDGFFGTDTINYTITDGQLTDTATLTISIEENQFEYRITWDNPISRVNGEDLQDWEISEYVVEYRLSGETDFIVSGMISYDDFVSNGFYSMVVYEAGDYEIQVKTVDSDGQESEPSDPVGVNIGG